MIKKFCYMSLFLFMLSCDEAEHSQDNLFTGPIGVQTYTFRRSEGTDPGKILDSIKMFGFTEIEGGSGRMAPAEYKKLCDDRGISIPSTGVDYADLVNEPDSVAWKAGMLGAKYVMCAWIPHEDGVLSFEDAKRAVKDFNRAGKILKDQGITFCYHAHGYEFQPWEGGTLLDYLFENTKPEYVSFEMDIFWIQFGGGDPVALLKKYGDRWKLMHIKDMRRGIIKDLTGQTSVENDVALGTGELDLPAILKEARRIGISHYFIEDESSSYASQLPVSIAYLKNLKE
jgi:sugar phosphate isomerase/epimerase